MIYENPEKSNDLEKVVTSQEDVISEEQTTAGDEED
jgi:hypothetical protein